MSYRRPNLDASDQRARPMTFERVQFQPGMSLSQFLRSLGTEGHCPKTLLPLVGKGASAPRAATAMHTTWSATAHGASSSATGVGIRPR